LRKTILLLVSVFTVTLCSFTHTTHAVARQYPAGQRPGQQPTGPSLDQLKAKDFTVRTLDGENVSLNKLLGEGKPVLIDFWATWCGPCRMVIPHLGELHRRYGKDGLVVIGMNLEDPRAEGQAVKSFVKRNRMDYQIVFAPHAIYQFFSGMAAARIPYTLLFGADGTLTWRLLGYSPQMGSSLNGAVAKAMAGAPEKRAEQGAPEKQTEQSAPEKQTEQSAPEKPAEKVTPEKPTEQGAPEKPMEQEKPEKPTEQGKPEKPTELAPPEKPVEQPKPETKTCTCKCPCCSSPATEKQTQQSAPERPAAQ
jgi:cytochrome c biogenesis protein CcmG, thiol:disulfide interchange protein DsbE